MRNNISSLNSMLFEDGSIYTFSSLEFRILKYLICNSVLHDLGQLSSDPRSESALSTMQQLFSNID